MCLLGQKEEFSGDPSPGEWINHWPTPGREQTFLGAQDGHECPVCPENAPQP